MLAVSHEILNGNLAPADTGPSRQFAKAICNDVFANFTKAVLFKHISTSPPSAVIVDKFISEFLLNPSLLYKRISRGDL